MHSSEFWPRILCEDIPTFPLTFSPTDLGMPVQRPRQYVHVRLCKDGREDFPFNLENFSAVAYCSVEAHGSIYLRADPDMVRRCMGLLAAQRCLPPREGVQRYSCRMVMDTADCIRMEGYRQHAIDMGMEDRHELISNVRQSHTFFTSLSTRVPTLMRKSQVYCFAGRGSC